jgi:hypothetical protein
VHEVAIRQHRFDAEYVMNREPVFEAMRAAGIFGDIAADRANRLA